MIKPTISSFLQFNNIAKVSLLFICLLSVKDTRGQAVSYQNLFNNNTFSKTIDQSKPVGAIAGNTDVTLTGGATYTIPIQVPPGTNGMEPKVTVQYNSQAGSGIAGWGWNITGMSAIVRTPKSNFLDDEVKPVSYATNDAYSLDGNRLYVKNGAYGADGTTYDKEQIDFSVITSMGNVGSGPKYFTVADRMGTTYEYGNTPDSRVLTDDGNHVMMWRLNKVQDVHGNYIEYVYQFNGRETLLKEINYTGNAALGLLPYNKVSFEYAGGRVDQNTVYEGGASLNSKSILQSIIITGENNVAFKKYRFEYAKDGLYSYLQEVKEFGADNYASQLNSTIFKYGEQPVTDLQKSSITINNVNSVLSQLPVVSGDYDGDGSSEIVVFNTGNSFNLYKKLPNGNYDFISSGALTSSVEIVGQQAKIKHEKSANNTAISLVTVVPSTIHQSFHNNRLINVDMNGDSKEDIINITTSEDNQGLISITNLGFLTYNAPNTQLFNYLFPLPPDGFINIDASRDYFSTGDFDGDSRTDLILYVSKIIVLGNIGSITVRKAFLYSAKNNFQPKVIKNLFSPNAGQNEETNIRKSNTSPELTVVNFDGDNKNEVMVTDIVNNLTYTFSLNFINNGDVEAVINEVKNANTNTNVAFTDYLIRTADFNGDGKTDLLTHDMTGNINDWKIYYSTGKGLVSSAFVFNMPNVELDSWMGQQATAHPRDNLLIADFNGDGRSDILHGKSSLMNNGCNNNDYYIDIYYGANDMSKMKSYTFSHDVLECPGNNIVFPVNGFVPTDLNGDGRVELIYKTKNAATPLAKLTIKEFGQEGLLQKIIDGNNNKTELRYELISKGMPLHEIGGIAPVTANNFDVNYPLTSMQVPMNVVSILTVPDGIGGNNSTSFTYKEAVSHQAGKGFLGFLSVTAANTVTNTKTVSSFMPSLDRSLMWVKNIETYQLNNNALIAKKIYNNSFFSYGGKLFQQRNEDDINQNVVQGFSQKTTNQVFDYWGNVTKSKAEIFKTANNNIEESTILTQYVTPGTASAIPSVPDKVDISQVRTGEAAVSKQTAFAYFSNGKLKNDVQFSNTAAPVTTDYTYTAAGNLNTQSISAAGSTTRKKYIYYDTRYRYVIQTKNATSPLLSGYIFDDYYTREPLWGHVVSTTSSDCQTSTSAYDAFGRVTTISNKVSTPDAYTVSTARGWNINGLLNTYETVTHPGKPDLTTYFDKLGRKKLSVIKGFNNEDVSVSTSYDVRGNIATETNSYLASETPVVTTYTYDDLNRLASTSNNLATIINTYTFVNGDLQTTTTNTTTGQVKSMMTDPAGKVLYSTDHGGTIDFAYDSWGNEIKAKKGAHLFTTKTYNAYNRLVTSTDANAGAKTYSYNAMGELIQETDALGNVHEYVYDVIGRLYKKTGTEGAITYTYGNGIDLCKKGYLTHTDNFNGIKEDYEYDGFGRLSSKSIQIDGNSYTHKYAYDKYDNILSTEYPSGYKTYNEYTSDSYLNKVGYATVFNGQGQPVAFNYFYTAQAFNGMGQPKKYLLGNGYSTTKNYQYGHLLHHDAKAGNNIIHNMDYAYNYANGNLISRKDNFTMIPQTEMFTYDNLDRLTSTQVSVPNFTFPAISYSYDGINNSEGNLIHGSSVANFGYGAPKYHAVLNAQGIYPPPGPGLTDPTILPNANVISDLSQDITYTPFQKTSKITEDNREIKYTYDANYDRVKSVFTNYNVNQVITKYYLGNYESRTNPQGQTYRIHYITAGDGLCAMVTMDDNNGTQVHYVYTDHLGSVSTVTDATGNIEARRNFDAWGRLRNPDDWNQVYPSISLVNNNLPEWLYRGYTGHEHLPEFALVNMNGRMYDPALGRMCSPDIYIADPYSSQAYNRYTYANNNPLKFTDPTGNIADWYTDDGGKSLIYFDGVTSDHYSFNNISYSRVGATGDNIWFKAQYFTLGGGADGWGPSAWLKESVIKDRNPYYHRNNAEDIRVMNNTADGLSWLVRAPVYTAPAILGGVEAASVASIDLFCSLIYKVLPYIPLVGAAGRTAASLLDETGSLSAAKGGTSLIAKGLGSTGRTTAANLTEQLAMQEIISNPTIGNIIKLKKGMTDIRWPVADGWQKMSWNNGGVEIHYVGQWENGILKAVDDFKFIGEK